jgi:purine-binding chemotaxis protein CheW
MTTELQYVPLAAPWLLGAINLRGSIINVVDLARLLGVTQDEGARSAVAVVVYQKRLLGLLVDDAADVVAVAASALQALHMSQAKFDQKSWLTHCFEWGPDNQVISVLSVAALQTLGNLPWIEDRSRGASLPTHEQAEDGHSSGQRRPYLYLGCEDMLLGLDAQLVHTSLSHPVVRTTFLTERICQGVTDFNGRDLAVIDLLAFLGLGETSAGAQDHLVVLRMPTGLVGVLVSQVLEVVQVADEQINPIPAGAVASVQQFSGVVMRDDGSCVMVLDVQNLLADAALHGWAAIHGPVDQPKTAVAPTSGQTGVARKAQIQGGYLAFEAAGSWLVRLAEVSEIIPFPAQYSRTCNGRAEVLGLFLKDGSPVLLVSLNAMLKRPVAEPDGESKVLVVRHGVHRIGFVVQSLTAIEPLGFEAQALSGLDEPADGREGQGVRSLVFLGSSDGERLGTVLELSKMVPMLI